MPLIEVENLCKTFRTFQRREGLRGAVRDLFQRRYETVRAVDSISFSIEPGERVGYIGPNGAGKSTTIKMLTGILCPTSGRVLVDGLEPSRDRERHVRGIGVVFGQRTQLWWDLAVVESFKLLTKIYGVSDAQYKERFAYLNTVLHLEEYLHTPVRKLSLGQKMRCELAAALLHDPGILFLDEPTIGLDVVSKAAVREFLLTSNREKGTTLLLTTHDLGDIEELCERIIIIHRGKLLFDGPLDALRSRLGGRSVLKFRLSRPSEASVVLGCEARGVTWEEDGHGTVAAQFDRATISRAEVIRCVLDRVSVDDVSMEEVTIEAIVRDIFNEGDAG